MIIIHFAPVANASEPSRLHAHAGILMDRKSGRILWSLNPYEERAMASTTKIMTSIIAIENGNLEDTVVVSKKAASAPPVKLNIKPGEEYKLKDLLYALMLESSNDVAVAIAEHVGGSTENFCEMMTLKAREIGAMATTYKTPNGLDSNGHQSSAYDLALIADYALCNDTFLDIINTPSWQVNKINGNHRMISVRNKNNFLFGYDGAYGVKTGFTNKAGYCFVGAAKRGDMDLISVVLASGWPPQRNYKFNDTMKIMNHGFNDFTTTSILEDEKPMGDLVVIKGKTGVVGAYIDGELSIPLKEDEKVTMDYRMHKQVQAPVHKDDILGTLVVKIDNEYYTALDIRAKETVEREDIRFNFNRLIRLWFNCTTWCENT